MDKKEQNAIANRKIEQAHERAIINILAPLLEKMLRKGNTFEQIRNKGEKIIEKSFQEAKQLYIIRTGINEE